MNKVCQSCGMPLARDPQAGGTNADGSKSADYCSYCYERGAFKDGGFTAKQMQDFCIVKLQETGVPKLLAWMLARKIPKLKRWKPV